MKRRAVIKTLGLATTAMAVTPFAFSGERVRGKKSVEFKYCLNTSTIRGQKPGLLKAIDLAARAGFDSLELWVQDVKDYKSGGGSMGSLKKVLEDHKLTVEDAIGFAPWMVDDDSQRAAGFAQMREEMLLMGELGCKRIAAPPSGVKAGTTLDLLKVGARYKELLDLGRETGVMPLLEFWGSSPVFYHIGQALMAAAAADDGDARILPDVYHLFRGGSGFECLKMMSGHLIDVIHINDYPGNVPRTEQNDGHRVYPGDGVAPYRQIMTALANMGGTKVLSLELFNKGYWEQDALTVCKTGLEKMRKMVALAS